MVGCNPHFVLTIGYCGCRYESAKADAAAWEKATAAAKAGCPISRPFNTTITVDATLEKLYYATGEKMSREELGAGMSIDL